MYTKESKRMNLINYSLWIIYSPQEIANFCCTTRNFKVIPQMLLTNSLVETELEVRKYNAEPQQTARMLKILQVECWLRWAFPPPSEQVFPLHLKSDHRHLINDWHWGIAGKHINSFACIFKASADSFTQLPEHMHPMYYANAICKTRLHITDSDPAGHCAMIQ